MPAPNLQFYACSIHNFAASNIVLEEFRHALERAREGEAIPGGVVAQTYDALSTMLDTARALLADVAVADGTVYGALTEEVANLLRDGVLTQHCTDERDIMVEAITAEIVALGCYLDEQKSNEVSDVTEAKNALARIAKGGV